MKKFFIILLFIIFSSSHSFALEARDYSKGDNWLNLPNKPVYPVDVFISTLPFAAAIMKQTFAPLKIKI